MAFTYDIMLIFGLPGLLFLILSVSFLYYQFNRDATPSDTLDPEFYLTLKKERRTFCTIAVIIGLFFQTLFTFYLIKITPDAPGIPLFEFITVGICLLFLYGSFHFVSQVGYQTGRIRLFEMAYYFFGTGFVLIPLITGFMNLYMIGLICSGP